MQTHIWKYGSMAAAIALIIIGSHATVYAGDPAFAKTVFYVQ